MPKVYNNDKNVYEATNERLEIIFNNFDIDKTRCLWYSYIILNKYIIYLASTIQNRVSYPNFENL